MTDDFSSYDLEFRSAVDDAWYNARVVLDNDTLVVKFWNFSDTSDERFRAGDFQTVEAVDEFVQRFRPLSEQLQDTDCSKVIEGMTVCASFAFRDDDIRFYDAIVEAVHHVEHILVKEEECLCTFVLFWLHGPNEGNILSTSIAHVCLVRPFAEIDSRIVSFSKMVKKRIENASLISSSVCDSSESLGKGGVTDKESSHFSAEQKSSLSQNRLQVKEGVRRSGSLLRTNEGRISICHERNREDIDFGGESSMGETDPDHFILIENLEKDLSPSSIVEFIHRQTTISPQAYVFPSLFSESSTRGALVLDCKKKLKKIYDFLNNPHSMIISSRGRPWVISEKILRCGTFRTILGSLIPMSEKSSVSEDLKVIHHGAEEYRTAKGLRDLFRDFVEHQQRLHKRLALEEKKILQLSAGVSHQEELSTLLV